MSSGGESDPEVNFYSIHDGDPLRKMLAKAPGILKRTLNGLDPRMASVFIPWACRNPRYLPAFVRLSRAYRQSERTRNEALQNHLRVPPVLILSLTERCNLQCAGCYAVAAGTVPANRQGAAQGTKRSLTWEQWRDLVAEASELGVFCFIVAGGEPFLFPGLVELCQEFNDRLFIIFTNGTALEEADYERLRRSANTAVIVSIEGGSQLTDERRGPGVYGQALDTLKRLERIGVLSGISVTIDRRNLEYWMDNENVDRLIKDGIRLGFFIEYIPSSPAGAPGFSSEAQKHCADSAALSKEEKGGKTGNDYFLMLTPEERERFRGQILRWRSEKSIYLIHSPGDEEFFGGCVSAGRGFAHVTPAGDLTPCPVSNVATHNLKNSTLAEGLASPLFKEICENDHLLETGDTPCGLFAHPEEVDELAKAVGAYRTDNHGS